MDEDEQPEELGEPIGLHTVCHVCGGAGMTPDPKCAIIAGQARTIDNGRPCKWCEGRGYQNGLAPPV
ncbi:hypothetical protein [Tamaricihabitans halophyticus]|uniref:hypothetical protein n=1 Tax=Tamaricihabitans halophyticus TaxID=1262583 RepID=UPI00104EB627|nr:hypothetical protein [Tamaricihabitans halophyticus]